MKHISQLIILIISSIIIGQCLAEDADSCAAKGYLKCLDTFGECTKSNCESTCSSNSECIFGCCYKGYCAFSKKCSTDDGSDNGDRNHNSDGNDNSDSDDYDSSNASIIYIVLPIVFAVAIVVGVVVYCVYKKRKQQQLH